MARHDKRLKQGSLLGPHRIIRLIGEGGMGEVYEARDEALNRHVALKVIAEKFESQKEIVRRFMSEGQALARLNHQNVVVVYALGEEKGIHYIVMEYVDGYSLHEVLKLKGSLEFDEAVYLFRQLLEGVKALHGSGIIHRDIKPKNIIIRKDNSVKIVDFGIAKVEGQTEQEITKTGELVGSVFYLAPEIIEHEAATVKSDIWSLGVNFYEMLTGKNPFYAKKWVEVVDNITQKDLKFPKNGPDIAPGLKRIIRKMCERNASLRYSSVDEILQDLKDVKKSALIPNGPDLEATMALREDFTPQPVSQVSSRTKTSFTRTSFQNTRVETTSSSRYIALAAVVAVLGAGGWFFSHRAPAPEAIPPVAVNEPVEKEVTPTPTTVPEAPVPPPHLALISPGPNQKILVGDQEAVRLEWAGQTTENTALQVAKDAQFQILIVDELRPQSPYLLKNFKDDGIYFWRMVQKGAGPVSSLTETLSFNVLTQAPPQLIYPVSQTVYPETQAVKFYWQEKTGASQYRFQLSLDSSFQHLMKDVLLRENQTGSLTNPPGDYFWRVRVEENMSATSRWSEVRIVRVQPVMVKAAAAPAPSAKAKKEIAAKTKPKEKVGHSKGHESHSKKVVQTKPVTEKPKATVAAAQSKPDSSQKVPAVVKSFNANANNSSSDVKMVLKPASGTQSASKSAPVDPKASPRAVAAIPEDAGAKMSIPKIKLPPNGVSIVSLNGAQDPISFRWENINGAQGYRLELSTREDFSQILHTAFLRENQTVLTKKMPKGRIYWRVRAEKGSAKSDWSAPFYFEISK